MTIGLIGYRGSGKSTVGQKLADAMGRELIDTDLLIVQRAGKTIREIFKDDGEPAFRDMETQIVREISFMKNAVIAFGGGALDRPENRHAFAAPGHALFYLRSEPSELLSRIRADVNTAATRPDLTALGGGIDEIQTILNRREPIWRTLITGEIDVTSLTPDEVACRLVALFQISDRIGNGE